MNRIIVAMNRVGIQVMTTRELFDFVVIPTKFKNFACVAVEKDVSFRRLTGNGFRRTQDKRK